jgi:hypothetical protein
VKRLITSWIFLGLTFTFGRAEAICTPRETATTDNPKSYISAFVDALIVLKVATGRASDLKGATSPMDGIAVFETARQEYDCALSYVVPYEKSANKGVAASAESLTIATRSIQAISEDMRQMFRDFLDGKRETTLRRAGSGGTYQYLLVNGGLKARHSGDGARI